MNNLKFYLKSGLGPFIVFFFLDKNISTALLITESLQLWYRETREQSKAAAN